MIQVGSLSPVHKDHRREIFECNFADCSLQDLEICSGLPLGNHYHARKDELFIILDGGGLCFSQDVTPSGHGTGEVTCHVVEKGTVVRIHRFTAHAFLLRPGSRMLCFSSCRHAPDDMHPFILVAS